MPDQKRTTAVGAFIAVCLLAAIAVAFLVDSTPKPRPTTNQQARPTSTAPRTTAAFPTSTLTSPTQEPSFSAPTPTSTVAAPKDMDEYVAALQELVEPDVRVQQPVGKHSDVQVIFPPETTPETAAISLEKIQDIAMKKYSQDRENTLAISKRGSVTFAAAAVAPFSEERSFSDQWKQAYESVPYLEGHYNYGKLDPFTFFLQDDAIHPDAAACANKLGQDQELFATTTLPITVDEIAAKYKGCGTYAVMVHSKPEEAEPRFRKVRSFLESGKIPEGTRITTNYGRLIMEFEKLPDSELTEWIESQWDEDQVVLRKIKDPNSTFAAF